MFVSSAAYTSVKPNLSMLLVYHNALIWPMSLHVNLMEMQTCIKQHLTYTLEYNILH